MNNAGYTLSKTSFIKFEQCHKAFFLYKNHPYLRDKVGIDKQLTFKRGHDVGFYAQQLFPGGTDVSKETKNYTEALELTAKLVAENSPVIYEATFLYNGVLVMADILCFVDDKYYAYEVKSSLKISEVYLKDAYLQYYVIKNTLPALDDLFLVTLNPDYRLGVEADPRQLFKRRSIKQKAASNFEYFEHRIAEAHQVLEQNAIPNLPIGKHCFRPYQCDFFGTCWKDTLTEKSIFNIPLVDKNTLFEWYGNGIRNMDQINNELDGKQNLQNIKNALVRNEPVANHAYIKKFTDGLKAPLVAMDMEIWNPAIPELQGTGPFEQIPFLVCFYDGDNYFNFFTGHNTDEREEFARQLCELSQKYATLLVYDKTMEVNVIAALAMQFPAYAVPLNQLKEKLADLFDIFVNVQYYDPAFKNNFTLKGVSGVMLKDVNYSAISSGLEAMNYYDQYRQSSEPLEKERLKQELINYCNTDCYATFKLAGFFKNLQ